MVEIKDKGFIDVVTVMSCQNSSWINDLWRRENPGFSDFTRYDRSSGTKSRISRVYTDIKIANNTKTNHIIVFFSDNYNLISKKELHSETKIGKD